MLGGHLNAGQGGALEESIHVHVQPVDPAWVKAQGLERRASVLYHPFLRVAVSKTP